MVSVFTTKPIALLRSAMLFLLMAKQKTPTERLAELQEQMKAAKEDVKAAERKRCEIIGAAIISLVQSDAEFKAMVLPKIRKAVTNPRDKAAIETLLV